MKNKVITNFMQNIRKKLLELSKGNEEYAIFNKKIVNTKKEVLGVRSPDMRKFAKDLAKEMNFEKLEDFLKSINENIFEEVCLFGFLVAYTKISDIEKIKLTKKYLKYVDNWALIDSFVSSFKRIDKDLWGDFASECLKSEEEFVVRFGIIFMMGNFLNEEYIDDIFSKLRNVKQSDYYVKMGIAWLYATAGVKFYDKTLEEAQRSEIDYWTKNKALQKMLESYRFNEEQKREIRRVREEIK